MIKIAIVLGSTRVTSLGMRIFKYLEQHQAEYEKAEQIELKFITLDHYKLPFFYEELPPLANKQRELPKRQNQWLLDMAEVEGVLFLTPEYNHNLPAGLKNAVDYLGRELARKPIKILSYSDGNGGGEFGGYGLMIALSRLNTFSLPSIAAISKVQDHLSEEGQLNPNSPSQTYLTNKFANTIHEIAFYAKIFQANPYQKRVQ